MEDESKNTKYYPYVMKQKDSFVAFTSPPANQELQIASDKHKNLKYKFTFNAKGDPTFLNYKSENPSRKLKVKQTVRRNPTKGVLSFTKFTHDSPREFGCLVDDENVYFAVKLDENNSLGEITMSSEIRNDLINMILNNEHVTLPDEGKFHIISSLLNLPFDENDNVSRESEENLNIPLSRQERDTLIQWRMNKKNGATTDVEDALIGKLENMQFST